MGTSNRTQKSRGNWHKTKRDREFRKVWCFEEDEDEGQETVDSRWVITRKEKADGQKQKVKGRLVAKGFQEKKTPQSDSPTMLRESMKMFFSGSKWRFCVKKNI